MIKLAEIIGEIRIIDINPKKDLESLIKFCQRHIEEIMNKIPGSSEYLNINKPYEIEKSFEFGEGERNEEDNFDILQFENNTVSIINIPDSGLGIAISTKTDEPFPFESELGFNLPILNIEVDGFILQYNKIWS